MDRYTVEILGRGIFFTGTPEALVTMLRLQWNRDNPTGILGTFDANDDYKMKLVAAMGIYCRAVPVGFPYHGVPLDLTFLRFLATVNAIALTQADLVQAATDADAAVERIIAREGL